MLSAFTRKSLVNEKKQKNAHNSLLRARRGLLRSFLNFQFFIFLDLKSLIPNLHLEERSFVTIIIFSCFPPRKSDLKFKDFEFNLLLTFDLTTVDNFVGHILNQHTCFYLSKSTFDNHPPTQPPIHSDNKFIRIEKHTQNVQNCRLRLLDGF